MKDLTHYFHSPPQNEKSNESVKTPGDESGENNSGKKNKKSKKGKKRKNNPANEEESFCDSKIHSKEHAAADNKFLKSSDTKNNYDSYLSLMNSVDNSDSISADEMKLEENIEIENIPRSVRHGDCYRVDDKNENVTDLTVSRSVKKHKRKRRTNLSENEPKKRVRINVENDLLRNMSSVSVESSVDENTSVLDDIVIETNVSRNSKKSVKLKKFKTREFVGIKLKKVKNFSEGSSDYEVNYDKPRKNKKIRKRNKSEDESENDKTDEEFFKDKEYRIIRVSKGKKVSKKFKKKNLGQEKDIEECLSDTKNMVQDLIRSTDSHVSDVKACKDDFKEDSEKSKIESEKPESERRNSLFNYYTKIDKAEFQATKKNEKIKVEAIIHTLPQQKSNSSSPVNDGNEQSTKPVKRKHSKKQVLSGVDEITLLSSEIISVSDDGELRHTESEIDNCCDSFTKLDNMPSQSSTPVKFGSLWRMRVSLSTSKSQSVTSENDDLISLDSNKSILFEESSHERILADENITDASHTTQKGSVIKSLDTEEVWDDIEVISYENNDDMGTPCKTNQHVPKKKSGHLKSHKTTTGLRSISKLVNGKSCERNKSLEHKVEGIKEIKVISPKCSSTSKFVPNGSINSNKKSPSGADIMAKFLGISPKKSLKPNVDPVLLEARQRFLESGVPDIIKQKIDSSQSEKVLALPAPFPKISHIQQRNPHHIVWNLPPPSLKLYPSPTIDLSLLHPKWTSVLSKSKLSSVDSCNTTNTSDFPLVPATDQSRCIKRLKKDVSLSCDVGEYWEVIKEMKAAGSADFDVWSEVYKPRKSSDLICNYDNIQKLRSWMESLKNNRLDIQDGDSSSGDFVDSDCEAKTSSLGSTCIISGPNGCGKTSAVFAVANELGYKVFEVNASSNRNGKKVLTDLSEATQSHQVEHSQSLTNFFKQGNVKAKKKKKEKERKAKGGKTGIISEKEITHTHRRC